MNQFQKQVKEELRVEMQASSEKFCNSISLRDRSKRVLPQNQKLSEVKGSARLSNTAPRRQSRQDKRRQSATLC